MRTCDCPSLGQSFWHLERVRFMPRKYSTEQLLKAYKCSMNNKKELAQSEKCGCFSCLAIYYPFEIDNWITDETGTAICPYCYEDTVIGDVFGHPITREFLEEMKNFFFEGFDDRWYYGSYWGCYWQ